MRPALPEPSQHGLEEVFSPMVYAVAGELFSGYLSQAVSEPPFRGFADVYAPTGITIRNSAVIDAVPV